MLSVLDIPSLRDARVPYDVVQADVAACLHPVSCEEEGCARNIFHRIPALVQNEPLFTEAALVIEQETKCFV